MQMLVENETREKKSVYVRFRVKQLLKEFPETRGDDQLLLLYYWQRYDGIKFNSNRLKDSFSRATPAESITRARRNIQYTQNEEDLLPDKSIVEKRKRLAQEYKQEYIQGQLTLDDFDIFSSE